MLRILRRLADQPLLQKELLEQSARRRTYVVRVVYALLLFGVFAIIYASMISARYYGGMQNSLAMMGRGRDLLYSLVGIQFFGIYLFLPAMMISTIAPERERGSLPLLLITGLGPWRIVTDKLWGRLIPMFTLVLLSVPLMGLCYAMGGVELEFVVGAVLALVVTCLQAGALGLMFSSICRTVTSAFISCYITCGVILLFAVLLASNSRFDDDIVFGFLPAYHLFDITVSDLDDLLELGARLLIPLALALLCMVGARLGLKRVFPQRGRPVLVRVFRRLDRTFHQLNKRLAGGITLGSREHEYPEHSPVLWREYRRSALAKPRYLVRLALMLETPVLLLLVLSSSAFFDDFTEYLISWVLWVIVGLILLAYTVNLFSAERSGETLDVLRSTPLRPVDIVWQKIRPLGRIVPVLSLPFLTLIAMRAWSADAGLWKGLGWYRDSHLWRGTGQAVFAVFVFLSILGWLGLLCGMWVRNRGRAIIAALSIVVAWAVLPFLVAVMFSELLDWWPDELGRVVALYSPVAYLVDAESLGTTFSRGLTPQQLVPPTLFYLGVLGSLIYASLRGARRALER